MTTKNAQTPSNKKPLQIIQFGNPILRQAATHITKSHITSPYIQSLIKDMRFTLTEFKLGVGLAATQVGEGVSLAIVVIQPTEHRPEVEPFEMVVINPVITQTIGKRRQLWEGCISSGKAKTGLFAKVPRYNKIKLRFTDEQGIQHHRQFTGLQAHVLQHETDHLNGILFVDKVKDTTTYMTYSEYLKHTKKAK